MEGMHAVTGIHRGGNGNAFGADVRLPKVRQPFVLEPSRTS